MYRLFARTLRHAAVITVLAAIPAAALAECCIVPDNGFGTATLPPQSTVASTCMYLGNTEITDGLEAGDWILADAQAVVEDGDRVRVAASALPGGAADSATRKELPAKLD